MQLSRLLDVWMEENKLSVREFARELGVSYTVLHKFRHGGSASDETLAKILRWVLQPLKTTK